MTPQSDHESRSKEMTVTSVPTPLARVAPPRSEMSVEDALISATEIRKILYLAIPGGADHVREAEDHAVDTYA
jgi:hypothetical protein